MLPFVQDFLSSLNLTPVVVLSLCLLWVQLLLVNIILMYGPRGLKHTLSVALSIEVICTYLLFMNSVNYDFGDDIRQYFTWLSAVSGESFAELVLSGHPDFGFTIIMKLISIYGADQGGFVLIFSLAVAVGTLLLVQQMNRTLGGSIIATGAVLFLVMYNRFFIEFSVNTLRSFVAALVLLYAMMKIYEGKYHYFMLVLAAYTIHQLQVLFLFLLMLASSMAIIGEKHSWALSKGVLYSSIVYFLFFANGHFLDPLIARVSPLIQPVVRSGFYFSEYQVSLSLQFQYFIYLIVPGVIIAVHYPYDLGRPDRKLAVFLLLTIGLILFVYPSIPAAARMNIAVVLLSPFFLLQYARRSELLLYVNVVGAISAMVLAKNYIAYT